MLVIEFKDHIQKVPVSQIGYTSFNNSIQNAKPTVYYLVYKPKCTDTLLLLGLVNPLGKIQVDFPKLHVTKTFVSAEDTTELIPSDIPKLTTKLIKQKLKSTSLEDFLESQIKKFTLNLKEPKLAVRLASIF